MNTERVKRDCHCPRARHQHGTYHAYNADGCHCDDCRHAASRQRQINFRRRCQRAWAGNPDIYVPVAGSVRRLQALGCIGWSTARLADEIGINAPYLHKIREATYPTIRSETAQKIAAAYDLLWDSRLDDTSARKTKASARNRGWLPPLAWDDDLIDDPAAAPDPSVAALTRPTICPECGKRFERLCGLTTHRQRVHGVERAQPAETVETAEPPGEPELDEIAVERYMAGTLHVATGYATPPELVEAARRLAALGLSIRQIGARLGMTTTGASQLCSRNGIRTGHGREDKAA